MRDVAAHTLILLVSSLLFCIGGVGLVNNPALSQALLSQLLLPDAALAIWLISIGLVATLCRRRWLVLASALSMIALSLYTLGHNALSGSAEPSWLVGGLRIASPSACLLLLLGICMLAGVSSSWRRWLWRVGSLVTLLYSALVARSILWPEAPGVTLCHSAPGTVLALSLLTAIAMLAMSISRHGRQPAPGRLAVAVALAGGALSCLAWLVLSIHQRSSIEQQADYLLDSVMLNAEQLAQEHWQLVQRMADRLEVLPETLPPVLEEDVQNHFRDTPSLNALALQDARQQTLFSRERQPGSGAWLGVQLANPSVQRWLSIAFDEPHLLMPDINQRSYLLLAIPVTNKQQKLVAAFDLRVLLGRELRTALGPFTVEISRSHQALLSLKPWGSEAAVTPPQVTLAQRYGNLPGGVNLTLRAYPGSYYRWCMLSIMPVSVAFGGAILSWLLAFSVGVVSVSIARAKALALTQQSLARSEQCYRSLFEYHPDAVFSLDADGYFISVNATCAELTGYAMGELLGRHSREFVIDDDYSRCRHHINEALQGHISRYETTITDRHAQQRVLDIISLPINVHGEVQGVYGIARDITQHKAYETQLAFHATHDDLTGLANRSLFEKRLCSAFSAAQHKARPIGVLFVDLDEFKPINDSLGHAVGDEVLIEVARRLEGALGEEDAVARLGGDEFVLLLGRVCDRQDIKAAVERLLPILAAPYTPAEHELYLTASIGIAMSDAATDQPEILIQHADMAMYRAKQQGRNAYAWFQQHSDQGADQRVALRNDLQEAIENESLALYYQPLSDRHGKIVSVEALLRWHHPTKGYISPADFIPLAEATGQVIPISEWVLKRACADMHALKLQGLDDLRVAVNLSPMQFHRANFLETLIATLDESEFSASLLTLELTEGVLMDQSKVAIERLHALRRMGVKVAIDDFGTGFSSLSYLKHLPVSTIKIDRSFIQELVTSSDDAAIVQGIISMAHHLGLRVVAEGVETHAQHQQLLNYRCDYFQGLGLADAMPLASLAEMLAAQSSSSRLTLL